MVTQDEVERRQQLALELLQVWRTKALLEESWLNSTIQECAIEPEVKRARLAQDGREADEAVPPEAAAVTASGPQAPPEAAAASAAVAPLPKELAGLDPRIAQVLSNIPHLKDFLMKHHGIMNNLNASNIRFLAENLRKLKKAGKSGEPDYMIGRQVSIYL